MENNIPGKNKAIASLVLGIVSLVLAWFGYSAILAIVAAIVGIVLAISARKEMPEGSAGMATAGMVCSIIGLAISCIVFIACVICFSAVSAAGLLS